jgi:putative hydrolase of the HAD superfamily
MGHIKAVFFDAAGTLFETRRPVGETYANVARAYSVDADPAAINAAFRRSFHEASPLAFGPGRPPEELRRLERDWWSRLVAKTFAGLGQVTDFDAFFETLFELFSDPLNWTADDEAISTLSSLRGRGLTLGVISNFDYRIYRILDGLGLSRWFDSITISSEAGYAKPSVKLFQVSLERHGLSPGEALHIGDSEHLDLAGASAAGLAAALIDRKLSQRILITGRVARISSLGATLDLLRLLQ